MNEGNQELLKVCFIGGARYPQPLDVTNIKKFQAMTTIGNIFIIGFSQTLAPRRFTEYARFYLLPNLPLPILRHITLFTVGCLLAFWMIARRGVRVMIAQSPYEAVPAVIVKMIARGMGIHCVLVIESHGDFEKDFFLQRRIYFPRVVRFIMHHIARFVFKRADVVRSISASTTQQLQRWKPNLPIVQFIAWTDIDVFLQAGQEQPKTSPPMLLYTGVLIPRKGVIHLINAFAAIVKDFPQVRLTVLGRADDPDYVKQLNDRVRDLELTPYVRFVGQMQQQHLARWMAQAYVFILPSLSEGLGRVVVEAMAAGTPVIGSRTGGIADVIQDGKDGFLVPPGDEITLADTIRWCLEHPEATQEMGKHAQISAQTLFSTSKWLSSYQQLFETAQSLL